MQAATPRRLVVDLRNFRPTTTQARFLASRDRFAAFFAGYGAGKSRAGAEKALRLALLNPGCTGLMVGPTWQMTTRLTLDTFLKACPKDLIAEHHRTERRIELVNGARIYFGSADKPGSLEGVNVSWAWLDEARLMTVEAWRTIVGRVREKRARVSQTFVTTTPAMGWLSDFFDGSERRARFHGSTQENAHNLAPGFVEEMRRTYSPRLARSLIDGHFTVVEGQVYECFDDARHLVEWAVNPQLPTLVFMDFGVRKGSVGFAQQTGAWPTHLAGRVLPPHSLVIFDELQPEQLSTERTIPLIQAVLRRHGIDRIAALYCDPAGNARDIAGGMTSVHLLQSAFGHVVAWQTDPQHTWIPNGIGMVESALNPLEGAPTLYLDRRLSTRTTRDGDNDYSRGVYKALRGYSYPEAKNGRAVSDHPVKDGHLEHAADMLRYGVVNATLAGRRGPQQRLTIRHGFG